MNYYYDIITGHLVYVTDLMGQRDPLVFVVIVLCLFIESVDNKQWWAHVWSSIAIVCLKYRETIFLVNQGSEIQVYQC